MISAAWLPFSALFPLLLTALPAVPALRRHQLLLLPLAPLPALAAGLLVPDGAAFTLPHALMSSAWEMDSIGRVFQVFTAFGWFTAALFSVPYFRDHPRKGPFVIPFLIAMSGNLLLPAAADAVTFYTGFGVMSFASWGLVVHAGTPEARRAGRVYLALVVLGELMVFPGLVKGTLWAETPLLADIRTHWALDPDPRFQIGLIFFGFALKAGLFPFHFWLPLAHPAAPAPASAVLSGCMIKAGLLAWLRLVPFGEFAMPGLANTITLLAATGMVGALLIGFTQSHPKALLAYSSLAKMGMMMLFLAPALAEPALAPLSISAVLAYAVFHALHKSALFLGAGLTAGLNRTAWVPLILLTASFAGFPGLGGAFAKAAAKPLLDELRTLGFAGYGPLLAGTLLTFPLMYRLVMLSRPGTAEPAATRRRQQWVWLLTVAAALLFPFWAASFQLLPAGFDPLYAFTGADAFVYGGIALTLLMVIRKTEPPVRIPPGDLLNLIPPVPPAWRLWIFRKLRDIDDSLNRTPGGLAYLLITLILIGLMVSTLPLP